MRINPDLVSRAAVVAGLACALLAGGGGSFGTRVVLERRPREERGSAGDEER